MELIYIGDHFYSESGSVMSPIYDVEGRRQDWGFVQVALRNGKTVHIRQATEAARRNNMQDENCAAGKSDSNDLLGVLRAMAMGLPVDTVAARNAAAKAADEIDRLHEALVGCVELAEFWIGQGREPGMSKERYEVWLALGHRSRQMQAAKAAISPLTPKGRA